MTMPADPMSAQPERPERPERIVIVRALAGLGDVLCAVPALRRLRAMWPDAHIDYIGLDPVRAVVARYPDLVDRFVPFPGFPGIAESGRGMAGLRAFLDRWVHEPAPDLAIQMHGSGSVSNVFTGLLGARRMAGWHVPGLWCPDPSNFAPFPDALSEVDRWLALVDRLGCPAGADRPDFPVSQAERAECAAIVPALAAHPYAVLHPGASDPRRRWPGECFAAVGDRLASLGLAVVLTGTAAEAPITAAVRNAMAAPAIDLAGRTSLGVMGALVEGARLVVTNDTGTAHLCAALRTPSVTIFIASDPARWAPADGLRHRIVGRGVADAPIGAAARPAIAELPPVADVLAAAEAQLAFA